MYLLWEEENSFLSKLMFRCTIDSLCFLDVLKNIADIVEIVHGSPVTIQALQANVILHVPEGVYGIILGNIVTNFRAFSHLVKEDDCMISPMCEFELHNYDDIPQGAWYTIQVPHIVKNFIIERKIKVTHRDKHTKTFGYALKLLTGEEPPSDDNVNVYYRLHEKYIEIFTQHFSQFIIYAENTTLQAVMGVMAMDPLQCCARAAELLVFGKWHLEMNDDATLEISIVMCSLHYTRTDLKQVSLNNLGN